jgi:hypothetical protein
MIDDQSYNQSYNQRQLEQATNRSLPDGMPVDEETVELRGGWLTMGRALDSESVGFRDEELLARLLPVAIREVVPHRQERPSGTDRIWPALFASALALTLLVAVVRIFWRDGNDGSIANSPSPSLPQTQLVHSTAAWSDPLDDEILGAAERLREIVAQGTGVDASLSTLSDHLESMSVDLTGSSL